ncbi:MAG: signal peptidase II [Nitrospinota bacterium]
MALRKSYRLFFGLALGLAALDQWLKFWVAGTFDLGESLPLIPGFLSLTHVRNTGTAFGLLAGTKSLWLRLFFIVVTVAALLLVFLLYRSLKPGRPISLVALPLVFGGGLGNLVDRVLWGEVVDFVDIYYGRWHWPAFNLADSCITVGVTLLVMELLFPRSSPP